MKRFLIPAAVLFVFCVAGAIYIGTLRPLAPEEPASTPQSMVVGVVLAATAVSAQSSPATPEAGIVGVELPTPTDLATSSPAVTNTSTQTARPTATPTRTRTATPFPTFPLALGDENLTETAVPAIKTLEAIATRAIATWTPVPGAAPTLRPIDGTTNFLLMGTDLRSGDPSWVPSTDVMMVLFVDQANNRAAILSLPRDLVVAIPHHFAFRINYVYQYGLSKQGPAGGAALVKQALHDEFNIRIDHWALVDFNGFQKIIDTLGGIDVNVPCPLEDTIDDQPFVIPAGNVHMDYVTAKRYVQSRYTTSDTSRNFRQQRVLWAMVKKGLQMNALDKLQPLWDQIHGSVQTDMSLFDMAALAPAAYQLDLGNHPERVHAQVLEYPAVYPFIDPGGAWLFMPNYQEIGNRLSRLFDARPIAAGTPEPAECPGK